MYSNVYNTHKELTDWIYAYQCQADKGYDTFPLNSEHNQSIAPPSLLL